MEGAEGERNSDVGAMQLCNKSEKAGLSNGRSKRRGKESTTRRGLINLAALTVHGSERSKK